MSAHLGFDEGDCVLVTGGCGFIGSAVIRHLLASTPAAVVNLDKLTYAANLDNIPQAKSAELAGKYRFERGDICDGAALQRLFTTYRPRAVMHLAAESHVDRSIDEPSEFIQTNVVGTFTLLQEALRFFRSLDPERARSFRFLHVSTDEVFGSLGEDGLFTETTAYAPRSPYSASKAASDHLVMAWSATYGLPVLISNCSNNFGPYHFPEKLIPHMIIKALGGEPLPVYGDGKNVRDWLYVEDHARALATILVNGRVGESYNVGARNERTNLAVVEQICDGLDRLVRDPAGPRRRLIRFVPDRPGHDHRYAIDAGKLERELGWRAQESFESALDRTIAWYLQNRGWWQAILERGYDPCRVGLGAVSVA